MAQRHAPERRRHVDRVLAERQLRRPDHLHRHRRQQLLGERHQPLVVHVRPVELEHRELGIVLRRDALITEVTIDLEDPFDAADGEPLQVELRRDAQVELHVERVVMRHERPRQRAAGDLLHHRRLDFEEAVRLQELPDRRHRGRANLEHPAHVGIDDQIEIALAVADLDVLQAVPLLRQRQEALGEELQRRRPDRQLVRLGAKQVAADADLIAEVEQLRQLIVALAERVLPDVDLDARAAVGQHEKAGLAETADADDAPGGDGVDARRLELGGGLGRVAVDELRHRMRGVELVRVRGKAEARDRLEVRFPLLGLDDFATHLLPGGPRPRRRAASPT